MSSACSRASASRARFHSATTGWLPLAESRPAPRPRLTVRKPPRNSYDDRLVGELAFDYEGQVVKASQEAQAVLPPGGGFLDVLRATDELPAWLTDDDLDFYAAEFSRTGFRGGLNWYRNIDRNWELTASPPAATIAAPSLFVAGSADPVLGFTARDRFAEVVSGPYREVLIDGAGHWIQQERPDEVSKELLDFLNGVELPR